MKRAPISLVVLALCACQREPSFDERFSASENEIRQQAREIDRQLDRANANNVGESGDRARTD